MAVASLIVYAVIMFAAIAFNFEEFQFEMGKLVFFVNIPSAFIVLIPAYLFAGAVSSWMEMESSSWTAIAGVK